MDDLKRLFGPDGPLSKAAPHYRFRPGQLDLAEQVAKSLQEKRVLLAEAGTGVGKTYGYLVPLMLSSGKALVSTATKHLQDQIFLRDLPRVKAALGVSLKISLLKGRSNYLCLHRLAQQQDSGRFTRAEDAAAFRSVVSFSNITRQGDISECTEVPEHSAIWPLVTSTRENCLGQNCPQVKECHVMAARKDALEADLVVVNHHLFCADLALRDQSLGDLLPTVEHVVIDEAHALPEIAAQFFGQSLSTASVSHLARDLLEMGLAHARDGASWPDVAGQLERAAADVRLLSADVLSSGRMGWDHLGAERQEKWRAAMQLLHAALKTVLDVLAINEARHVELGQLAARTDDLLHRLNEFLHEAPLTGLDTSEETQPETDQQTHPMVRWIEAGRYALTFHMTPFDIAPRFREELLRHQRAWVFVSATLAVAGRFQHIQERLGLEQADCMIAESPFDYSQQGLLLVPRQAPDPKAPDALLQLLGQADIQELLHQVPGGIFILCTSHRVVGMAQEFFSSWVASHPDRMLLVQGQTPRHQLIEQFRQHGRAVLIGSHSFWEGVDVPGAALSLVLIDKLPFAPPDDPVLEAKGRWVRRMGRDPFTTLALPEAAITLKQGVGRLIRTESDWGLVLMADRRLAETPFGRQMLRSLPAFHRTREVSEAMAWLKEKIHQNLRRDQTDGLAEALPPRSLGS